MFAPVLAILGLIPFEPYVTHMYNIHISPWIDKALLLPTAGSLILHVSGWMKLHIMQYWNEIY
jgi:hypothetical protein